MPPRANSTTSSSNGPMNDLPIFRGTGRRLAKERSAEQLDDKRQRLFKHQQRHRAEQRA